MSPCPTRKKLRQYLVGKGLCLDQIEGHVETCAACQAVLDQMTRDSVPEGTTAPNLSPYGYRVNRLLGSGSYGEVWLARDLNLPRDVALKSLRWRQNPSLVSGAKEALRNEAQLLTGLDHPHLVRIHAWLTTQDLDYLVMQYVPGGSLRDWLDKTGPLDWQTAARYIADVGEGLVEVHIRGIVHRDVKPSNILVDIGTGEALLTDFGISSRISDPSSVGGSSPYMPPEAFDGILAPAHDVYSLAATLFHLITGTPPFAGPSPADYRVQAHQGLPALDPRLRDMPDPLERVIRGGLHPDRVTRSTLDRFLGDLRTSLNHLSVDRLVDPPLAEPGPRPVELRMNLSRRVEPGRYEPIHAAPSRVLPLTRDIKRVPASPPRFALRTGTRLRLELTADRDGYITVFNVGPTGNLNLLFPESEQEVSTFIEGNRPLIIDDVELTPPTGRERIFAIWSNVPRLLAELQFFCRGEGGPSLAYRTTRDLKRVRETMQRAESSDCHTFVVELDHQG